MTTLSDTEQVERAAAAQLVAELAGPAVDSYGREAIVAALLAARQRGREESGRLLRRAVGILADIDRSRGEVAAVLDEFAGIHKP